MQVQIRSLTVFYFAVATFEFFCIDFAYIICKMIIKTRLNPMKGNSEFVTLFLEKTFDESFPEGLAAARST